jgi:hypothetical protein
MMRTVSRYVYPTLVCFILLLVIGCAHKPHVLQGIWNGTVTPPDGDTGSVELAITKVDESGIEGTFRIQEVSGQEPGSDFPTELFVIKRGETDNNQFKFAVPMTFKDDAAVLIFELEIVENRLLGYGYPDFMEDDEEQKAQVTFTKQK